MMLNQWEEEARASGRQVADDWIKEKPTIVDLWGNDWVSKAFFNAFWDRCEEFGCFSEAIKIEFHFPCETGSDIDPDYIGFYESYKNWLEERLKLVKREEEKELTTDLLVFYINVGNLPKETADDYVEEIKDRINVNLPKGFVRLFLTVRNENSHVEHIQLLPREMD